MNYRPEKTSDANDSFRKCWMVPERSGLYLRYLCCLSKYKDSLRLNSRSLALPWGFPFALNGQASLKKSDKSFDEASRPGYISDHVSDCANIESWPEGLLKFQGSARKFRGVWNGQK